MPFCSQCGHQNPDSARFCSSCGTRLAEPEAPAESSETTITFAGVTGGPGALSATPSAPPARDEERANLNAADSAAVEALPTGSALLVVQRGPEAGSRFLLDSDVVTAGRHPDSDIFLDDITVSRRHVEFRRDQGAFRVHDVGSLNGTYVNRDRIDDVALVGGDEVRIGKFRLMYFAGPSSSGS